MQPPDEPAQTTPTVALSQRSTGYSLLEPEVRSVESLVVERAEFERGVVTSTCPQCGLNHADTRLAVKVEYVPPWIYLTLFANVIVLAICYYAARKRVETSVMLCADCVRAEKRARNLRSLATWALVLVNGFGTVGLVAAESTTGMLAVGAAIAASWIGAAVVFNRTSADRIGAGAIDKHNVTLKVPTSWRRVLRAEAPALLYGPGVPAESSPRTDNWRTNDAINPDEG
jgi:hypothetical protein